MNCDLLDAKKESRAMDTPEMDSNQPYGQKNSHTSIQDHSVILRRDDISSKVRYHLVGRKVESAEIIQAEAIVKGAQEKAKRRTLRRLSHPRTNRHLRRNNGKRNDRRDRQYSNGDAFTPYNSTVEEPLPDDSLKIEKTVASVAALLAEYYAQTGRLNLTVVPENKKRHHSSYWLENVPHGSFPFNPAGKGYKVRRFVIEYFTEGFADSSRFFEMSETMERKEMGRPTTQPRSVVQ